MIRDSGRFKLRLGSRKFGVVWGVGVRGLGVRGHRLDFRDRGIGVRELGVTGSGLDYRHFGHFSSLAFQWKAYICKGEKGERERGGRERLRMRGMGGCRGREGGREGGRQIGRQQARDALMN
jgi:hypothetical protein